MDKVLGNMPPVTPQFKYSHAYSSAPLHFESAWYVRGSPGDVLGLKPCTRGVILRCKLKGEGVGGGNTKHLSNPHSHLMRTSCAPHGIRTAPARRKAKRASCPHSPEKLRGHCPIALGQSPHSFSRHPLIMGALAGYIFAPALHEGKLPSS